MSFSPLWMSLEFWAHLVLGHHLILFECRWIYRITGFLGVTDSCWGHWIFGIIGILGVIQSFLGVIGILRSLGFWELFAPFWDHWIFGFAGFLG